MNFYHIVYTTSNNNVGEMYVVASTSNNAWTACQAGDSTAVSIETIDELYQGVTVGS